MFQLSPHAGLVKLTLILASYLEVRSSNLSNPRFPDSSKVERTSSDPSFLSRSHRRYALAMLNARDLFSKFRQVSSFSAVFWRILGNSGEIFGKWQLNLDEVARIAIVIWGCTYPSSIFHQMHFHSH